MEENKSRTCSFCGRSESEVNLIAGGNAYICHECVGLCNQIIDGIRQGVYEAMMASNSGGRNGDINLYVSGKQLMTAVAEEARRETVRTGVNPLTQGG